MPLPWFYQDLVEHGIVYISSVQPSHPLSGSSGMDLVHGPDPAQGKCTGLVHRCDLAPGAGSHYVLAWCSMQGHIIQPARLPISVEILEQEVVINVATTPPFPYLPSSRKMHGTDDMASQVEFGLWARGWAAPPVYMTWGHWKAPLTSHVSDICQKQLLQGSSILASRGVLWINIEQNCIQNTMEFVVATFLSENTGVLYRFHYIYKKPQDSYLPKALIWTITSSSQKTFLQEGTASSSRVLCLCMICPVSEKYCLG